MSCFKLLLLFISSRRNNNNNRNNNNTSNIYVVQSTPPFTISTNNNQNSLQNLYMIRSTNAVSNVCEDNYDEDSFNNNNSKNSLMDERSDVFVES
jgi:hypothetical protein